MKIKKNLILVGIFAAIVASAQAQEMSQEEFNQSYKASCVKQQVYLHAKLKDISAESFNEFCDCATRQLIISLSLTQLRELSQNKNRPNWFKTAEQSAGKACLKEN